MRKIFTFILALTASFVVLAPAAHAYHDHWHHRHHRGGSGAYFSYSTGPSYYSSYRSYPYYYAPAPVIVEPQPVVMPVASDPTEDRYCREYQSTVRVGGINQPTYGTACMQPDGSWEIISQQTEP